MVEVGASELLEDTVLLVSLLVMLLVILLVDAVLPVVLLVGVAYFLS